MVKEQLIREINKGCLQWYPFEEGKSMLFIGDANSPLLEMLNARGIKTLCVSPKDAENGAIRTGVFDYIVAIASLEILKKPEKVLENLSRLLKKDGHLLLGVNNRLGIRYFLGDRDPYTGRNFDGVEDYRRAYSKPEDDFHGRCYDKATVLEVLKKLCLKWQCYSVFPDLNNAQIILRDDQISNEDFAIRILPAYNNAKTVFLEEEYLYNSLQKNHMLHDMANCMLFDCTFEGGLPDILQVTSSMGRDKENAFFTLIKGNDTVEKLPAYPEGMKRLNEICKNNKMLNGRGIKTVNGEVKDGRYVMPYVKEKTVQVYLQELIKNDPDAFIKRLDEFVSLILQSSVHISEDKGDGEGVMLEHAFPDMMPLNCFYTEDGFVFFDQEFCFDSYPANTVIYRAVSCLGAAIIADGHLDYREVLSRYGLVENEEKWQREQWQFIEALRNEKELRSYFEKVRHDGSGLYANRLRMNFQAGEYQKHFVNVFKNLGHRKLIVFGTGNFARQFMEVYAADYDVASVVDNNEKVTGTEFYGHRVEKPETLKSFELGTFRVMICIKNFLSVTVQLERMGITEYAVFDPGQQYERDERTATAVPCEEQTSGTKKYHIGYISGVFDLFHVGHLEKFKLAKEQCDYLIVGLVTDDGVRKYKKTDPFIPFEERKAMLEACRYVDEVVQLPFKYAGPLDAWKKFGFDVQFSGSDYVNDPYWLAEKEALNKHGVDIVFFPYTESVSSSKLKALIEKKLI